MRDLKTAVVTLLLTASLAAGCTGSSPEEDLDAKYQEGYDAGYGDAYDASYDGVAQHQYNEGWDDGWGVANTDSQAEIAEIQATVSGLEAAIALREEQRDSLLALLSDSQEFANQTIALAEAMNETVSGLHAMLGENATLVQQLQSDLEVQVDLVGQWQDTAWDNRASLRGADLSGANLSGADLTFVDLRDTILIGADLSGADLRLAIVGNADLSGADLSGASLIAVSWYNTICPDGTNSDDNGYDCDDNL
jgi:hypothetical protein